ncbi:MAG: lysine--tRNA ligase, partial [Verrucomicrobia bacterium]|nr:lysine--tRNA ligase [Verrucomicrobiota bacterium]
MEDTNSLIENRKAKLAELHERGVNPFSNEFEPTETCAEARGKFEEGRNVAVAGRITAHRDMGKSQFFDLRDSTGRIQIYAQKKVIGEDAFDVIKHLDLGDFLGVRGDLFQTRTGEITVKVQEFVVLSKALRPPPEKWHGLADTEIRYRQRYLDLIASEEVKKVFFKRSRIIWEIRRFLQDRGFIEVETPMMQAIPGGAAAQPFVTHHNSLGCDFYLRIALELYLKRLLVGGMDRVFEIGRNFRNEGISRRHNPEFTMLEVYQAYGNFKTMMELVESMVCHVAHEVNGRMELKATNSTNPENERIDLSPPWRKVVYKDLVKETAGDDWFELGFQGRKARAEDLGVEIGIGFEDFEITNAVFEKLIEPKLIQPTFVTHLLKELVP